MRKNNNTKRRTICKYVNKSMAKYENYSNNACTVRATPAMFFFSICTELWHPRDNDVSRAITTTARMIFQRLPVAYVPDSFSKQRARIAD